MSRPLTALAATAILASGILITSAMPAVAAPSPQPARSCSWNCNILFDDFDYRSGTDPVLAQHGWTVRTAQGGPGDEGASWTTGNVTFPSVDGNRVLQLTSSTDGTPAGTTEAEVSRTKEESLAGTYLARIKFSDLPASGPDGDPLVQSFFAISNDTPDCDPSYSETDFSEYLPNGGYGDPHSVNSETTWALTGADCSDSVEDDQSLSLAGWHTVMATVASGHVRYYVDGRLVADHSGHYYPRQTMSIDVNQWFIDLADHAAPGTSVWHEDVDYILYAKDRTLTPAQASRQVALLRCSRVSYLDRLSA